MIDPLDSLFPGGPNARSNGNVAAAQINLQTVKWQAGDFGGDDKTADGQAGREVEPTAISTPASRHRSW